MVQYVVAHVAFVSNNFVFIMQYICFLLYQFKIQVCVMQTLVRLVWLLLWYVYVPSNSHSLMFDESLIHNLHVMVGQTYFLICPKSPMDFTKCWLWPFAQPIKWYQTYNIGIKCHGTYPFYEAIFSYYFTLWKSLVDALENSCQWQIHKDFKKPSMTVCLLNVLGWKIQNPKSQKIQYCC